MFRTLNRDDAAITTQIAVINTLMLWFRAIQKLSGTNLGPFFVFDAIAFTLDTLSALFPSTHLPSNVAGFDSTAKYVSMFFAVTSGNFTSNQEICDRTFFSEIDCL